MKNSQHKHSCFCKYCKQVLPLDAFYSQNEVKEIGCCKACHSERTNTRAALKKEKPRNYLVITQVQDSELRKEMARNAHLKVNEMIRRNRQKRNNEEQDPRKKKGGKDGSN